MRQESPTQVSGAQGLAEPRGPSLLGGAWPGNLCEVSTGEAPGQSTVLAPVRPPVQARLLLRGPGLWARGRVCPAACSTGVTWAGRNRRDAAAAGSGGLAARECGSVPPGCPRSQTGPRPPGRTSPPGWGVGQGQRGRPAGPPCKTGRSAVTLCPGDAGQVCK